MLNLRDVRSGEGCTVIWLIGQCGDLLRSAFELHEEDRVKMVSNLGNGGVIIRNGNRTFAMSSDAAFYVKVDLSRA